MSKSSKSSKDAKAATDKPGEDVVEEISQETTADGDVVEVDESVEVEADDKDSNLGVAKKTKAEREAEKAEAKREAEREAVRRRQTPQAVKLEGGKNPRWWVPTMLAFMVAGLVWLVVFYLSFSKHYPIPKLGQWNMAVGFALIMIGFIMTTRWK